MKKHAVDSAAAAMWVAAFAVASAQQAAAEKKVWDGVYTSAQAARGKAPFERSCARCHNIELAGSQRGPALKGNAFWSKYENDNLGDAVHATSATTCRRTARRSSTTTIKADILAYIMSVNGMPAGNDELKADVRALEGIKIAKKTTWDGVFTAAQAERGKQNFLPAAAAAATSSISRGDRGPALKGDDFLAHWENGSVVTLFDKIRETMPPNSPTRSPTTRRWTSWPTCCSRTAIRRGRPTCAPKPRASASSIWCARARRARSRISRWCRWSAACRRAPNNAWTLTKTSEPVLTRDEEPSAAALRTAQAKALGAQTFHAGERRAVQAGDARGTEDGSARAALPGRQGRAAESDVAPGAQQQLSIAARSSFEIFQPAACRVRADLFRLRRAGDHRRDGVVPQQPRKRQLQHRVAALLRDRSQAFDDREVLVRRGRSAAQPIVHPRALRRRDAFRGICR